MSIDVDSQSETTTRGGVELDIRSAAPADRRKILSFLQATDAPDLRFRFLSAVKPSDALAKILTNVDHSSTEDLIAFDRNDGSVAATAMVAPGDDPGSAEIAILVRSDLKGLGIGWDMLSRACEYARKHGYHQVQCIESSSNQSAISLEREQGFKSRLSPQGAELTILTKDLV